MRATQLLRALLATAGRRRAGAAARGAAAPRAAPQLSASRGAAPRRTASSWGGGTPVTMPALSPTMASGKIARWNKQEGGAWTT